MQEQTTKKPKWLRRLEQESWQAELIISGLAIFGSLQIPGILDQLIDWCIVHLESSNFLLMLFFIYAEIASYVIILSFIAHFIIRAFWVGIVGLNSIFPDGIKEDGGMHSPTFMKLFMEDHPKKGLKITKLDDIGSGIFALCAWGAMIFISINIIVILIFIIKSLSYPYLPESLKELPEMIFGGFLVIYVIMMMILTNKRFKENVKLQTRYYKLTKYLNYVMYNIFYYPVTQIAFTFSTNVQLKKYLGYGIAAFIPIYLITVLNVANSNIIFLARKDALYDKYNRADRVQPEVYEKNLTGKHILFSTVIESEWIEGKKMKVFIPVFDIEDSIVEEFCGERANDESLSRSENRNLNRQFLLDCFQNYHRIYVNDTLYTSEMVKYSHPNKGENGVLTYLPTENFKDGKNILKVEKLEGKGDEVYRTMLIPFWFSK